MVLVFVLFLFILEGDSFYGLGEDLDKSGYGEMYECDGGIAL